MSIKIGILTFHAAYNCGSMLQTYALQSFVKKLGYDVEIIDFSNKKQRRIYSLYSKNKNVKFMIRNLIFYLHKNRILRNFDQYERFKNEFFQLSENSSDESKNIDISPYDVIIAGSDQIWNVTIADSDEAYFLPWDNLRKIAYAPSFGARNPMEYAVDIEKIIKYLKEFDALSIRENNGRTWIKEMIGQDVPVVLDPTLLLNEKDYEAIIDNHISVPSKYIFYYCPTYSLDFNLLVKKISRKYNLPVIAFNSKSYYLRGMNYERFLLPEYEDPAVYLRLMKNASLVITTSFHGTVFSTIFKRKFWVIKNGGMYSTDDRVMTLLSDLGIEDRLIEMPFDSSFDYMKDVSYEKYNEKLYEHQEHSKEYLISALEKINEATE